MSTERKPKHWEKRISAAYLRMLGMTQKDAAKAVGRSERTIRLWEEHGSWKAARDEAADRWLLDITDASRRAVLQQLHASDGNMGLAILQRLDTRLPHRNRKAYS